MQCDVIVMNGSDPSNVIDRYYELFQGDVRDLDSGSGLFDFWNVLTSRAPLVRADPHN